MRILIDTNVIISAVAFRGRATLDFFDRISGQHTLIITTSVLDEIKTIILRKKPEKLVDFEIFVDKYMFEIDEGDFNFDEEVIIRDPNDKHVIISALATDTDVLITGDKDFFAGDYGIEILTPAEFLKKYNNGEQK